MDKECAESLLRSKKVDGKRREFFVTSPSNAQVQVHYDEEKGPRQIKLEITTHKVTKVLKAKYGEDKFYCRKDAGKYSSGALLLPWQLRPQILLTFSCLNAALGPAGSTKMPCSLPSRKCSARSGVPNTASCKNAPLPCLGHDLGCVSWTARGLFTFVRI